MSAAQTPETKHNVLITGASGYLGGSILAHLSQLPSTTSTNTASRINQITEIANNTSTIYALVRTEAQTTSILNDYAPLAKQKSNIIIKPLTFNVRDQKEIEHAVRENDITVVFWLVDAGTSQSQIWFIKALAKVKEEKRVEVHFLHTSGAKIFSSLAGAPTDRTISDADADLYALQKAQVEKGGPYPPLTKAVQTNNTIIETSHDLGVRSYIFIPCIVYGQGLGVGNPISIQTTAIVKAARAVKKVYKLDQGTPSWPVSHISDTSGLYVSLLAGMVTSSPGNNARPVVPHGKQGYYLASSGRVRWVDIYAGIARALHSRGVIDDPLVHGLSDNNDDAQNDTLAIMADALGCKGSPAWVRVQIGGECVLESKRGRDSLGWEVVFDREHVLGAMEEEVGLILSKL